MLDALADIVVLEDEIASKADSEGGTPKEADGGEVFAVADGGRAWFIDALGDVANNDKKAY